MSTQETPELKAGHPPAVKAGGMRFTQHKGKTDDASPPPRAEGDILKVSTSPPKSAMVLPTALARETPQAIQAFHDKPIPTHENRAPNSKPNIIQQPRK